MPEHVLAALRSRRPLAVLRGPRGYGKTAAIRRWLAELDDGVPVLYLTLTEDSNELAGFWREFRAFLDAHGVPVADRGDDRWSVVSTLVEHPGRLLLVIDDFHEAGLDDGAASIDDDLVEIVRQNDRIDLVIGTRTYRTLETTGMLSVDGVVLGPDALKMSGRMVHALAQRLGVEMTLDEAEEIAIDTGGWPSAIRAGLVQSGTSGTFDAGLVDDYIVNLISDLRFPSVRAFLLRTAVPERFTSDMAVLIAPSMTLRILRNLRNAGMLAENRTSDGRMYSYAPAVRAALLRLGRELEPDTVREVHRTLMEVAAGARDLGRALIHAIEAAEYDTALQIIEREWSTLLASSPVVLVQAANRFPPEIAAREPRLRIALNDLHAAPNADSSPFTVDAGSAFAAELSAHLNAPVGASSEESLALLQWGITCLLVGNLDAASYAFNRARTLGLVGGGPDETVELAALGLALSHAFEGEPELAIRWLDDPGVLDRLGQIREVDGRDIVVVVAQLARAIALTDMVDPGAQAAVADLTEPGHRDDLWAATVFARAHFAVLSGERSEISRMSNEVRAAMRHVSRGSLIEVVLASELVELLIVDDAVDVAQQVVNRFPGSAISWAAEAKVALAGRRYPEAIAAANKAIAIPQRSWRTTVECHVVLTSAHHAMGDEGAAQEAFRHAVRMAQGIGQRRPFLLMPKFLFDGFAGDDEKVAALWPGPRTRSDEAAAAPTASSPGDLPTLTAREIQILRALESHPGPVGIGQDLGLSANTVKTHLRAIYRKLGVSSRVEALAAIGAGGGRST
ncbi:LuxR C-terminal-related transcriptional regulator [Pseudactinotalea suaedae]